MFNNRRIRRTNKSVETKFKLMRFNLGSENGTDEPELCVEYNNMKDVHEHVVKNIEADGVWMLVPVK